MAKIQKVVEKCNDCSYCSVFEIRGNIGGPYAAICTRFDLLVRINQVSDPFKSTIPIPAECKLEEYNNNTNTSK